MIVERAGLERRVLASLDAGRIPVVLGGCGTGRTSLLLRLQQQAGTGHAQYLDFAAAATTPEQCLAAVTRVSTVTAGGPPPPDTPTSPRAAFDGLMSYFDRARAADGTPATFLIDEILDIRTFENFPGLRHVQRDIVARLAASPARFVLASRFTARTHRLLRDAPARFEVVHMPSLTPPEVQALAVRFNGSHPDLASHAAAVAALAAGRATPAVLLLEALSSQGASVDPIAALAALCAPDGRLTARCRESYEFRLHRARGYGALKAILSILADEEPLNLTEISQQLRRTPGSTKDYLSWLEDVDLVSVAGKRYTVEDPLLRLYVRLHARTVPPGDSDVVREVRDYAASRLQQAPAAKTDTGSRFRDPVSAERERTPERAAENAGASSGIIEID
jgi:hypothetical protein